MLEELKEDVAKVKKMIYEWNWNISEETKKLRKKPSEILELKSTIAEI